MKRGAKPKFTALGDDVILEKLEKSTSFQGFIESLGYTSGRNQHTRNAVIDYLGSKGIDYKDYLSSNAEIGLRKRIPDEEMFSLGNNYRSGGSFIRRYLEKVDVYECSICGLTKWQGEDITLQVDHVNGNHYDNRLENLRLLCPNCHSQTSTFSNKRGKKLY